MLESQWLSQTLSEGPALTPALVLLSPKFPLNTCLSPDRVARYGRKQERKRKSPKVIRHTHSPPRVCRDSVSLTPSIPDSSLRAAPSDLPASTDSSPPTAPDPARAQWQIYWKLPMSLGIETSLNPYLPPSPSPRGHAEEQATESGGEGLVTCWPDTGTRTNPYSPL